MTSLLQINDKFITVRNKCSQIPLLTTMHFPTSVQRLRVFSLSWSSRFFMRAAAPKTGTRNSSCVYKTWLFRTHKKKTLTELGQDIQPALTR
jgi:hypothetical protein